MRMRGNSELFLAEIFRMLLQVSSLQLVFPSEGINLRWVSQLYSF